MIKTTDKGYLLLTAVEAKNIKIQDWWGKMQRESGNAIKQTSEWRIWFWKYQGH